jgi:hypothetical protein
MSARIWFAALLIGLLAPVTTAVAAAPALDGGVEGLEVAPQSVLGAALFVFNFDGDFNGHHRHGWGWIAINHDPLPTADDPTADINGGFGAIYIGLRRFDVEVQGGMLGFMTVDNFDVLLWVEICNAFDQCRDHEFMGVLSHEPLIPTIVGSLYPVDP